MIDCISTAVGRFWESVNFGRTEASHTALKYAITVGRRFLNSCESSYEIIKVIPLLGLLPFGSDRLQAVFL